MDPGTWTFLILIGLGAIVYGHQKQHGITFLVGSLILIFGGTLLTYPGLTGPQEVYSSTQTILDENTTATNYSISYPTMTAEDDHGYWLTQIMLQSLGFIGVVYVVSRIVDGWFNHG